VLLTEDSRLLGQGESTIIPETIMEIWPTEQVSALLDKQERPPLSRDIKFADRKKLVTWNMVDEIKKEHFLSLIQSNHFPTPATWRQLLMLWEYVAPEFTGYRYYLTPADAKIVPVQGKKVLYAASEVARLGEKKLLQSDKDWDFLANHLVVMNPNWARFLADQRRTATDQKDLSAQEAVQAAYAILDRIGLNSTSDASKVLDRVAADFFGPETLELHDCIRLAQIGAKLGATIGDSFRYVTNDMKLRSTNETILFDENGSLEDLVPEECRQKGLLNSEYTTKFFSCSREEWHRWVSSGQSGLLSFPPVAEKPLWMNGINRAEREARKRGMMGTLHTPYVTFTFAIQDWDFEEIYWNHWEKLSKDDDKLWTRVADHVFSQRETFWSRASTARIYQVATTGKRQSVTQEPLLPSWVLRLRNLPCLLDNRGFQRKPGDLLRRTAETESLIDVEPFVHSSYDKEATRPLLELLDVRHTPIGPDRLLDCLRALGKSLSPPLTEVEKWYRRLDQMVNACSTADFQKIRQAFFTEKLVLTRDGDWVMATAVFLSSDEEDVPGAPVIRSSVNDLSLWRKLGIAERPTADLAIQWLKTLPSGQALAPDDLRRVRAVLGRHSARIWEECQHWINLAGEWAPVDSLIYALSMQSLVSWKHMHQWVKQKTADLQHLSAEVAASVPFSQLEALALHVAERIAQDQLFSGASEEREWLRALGSGLCRIQLEDENETARLRALARQLKTTVWHTTQGLETVPYIGGTPAGTPRRADALWIGSTLYVDHLPKGRLARLVPQEIAKAFGRPDIRSALDYSFERSEKDIQDYLEENFVLALAESVDVAEVDRVADRNQNEDIFTPQSQTEIETDNVPTLSPEVSNIRFDDDEPSGTHTPGDKEQRARPARKPPKPSIIECFVKAQGFRRETDERFFHPNGSWIVHSRETPSLWERRNASGQLVRYYWPKDHCLEVEPLQLESDLWGLIEKYPESYALILANSEGNPVEMTGTALRAMRDDGTLTLFPASYRLVNSKRNEE